ncbi:MAG TPA: DUF885 domain-containing protein [Kofleriaceae bacterium]|nr:DUF885 domain-containing protein [Kofleriaceae bacterium]
MQRFVIGLPLVLGLAAAACAHEPRPEARIAPGAAAAQPTPVVAAQASATAPSAAPAPTLEERRKQLGALIAEQWEYTLRHSPELASILGDRRYNDRWSDLSVEAVQADLVETRKFLTRFAAVDTTGFPEQEALNQQLMVRSLKEQLDDARFEDWLMPVNQFSGIHIGIATLVPMLPFATVKDYDDYLARLDKLPQAFDQAITLMKLGLDKQLVPPAILLEQCVSQTEGLAKASGEASPFAQPLKKFPAAIARADQDRIRAAVLAAIRDKVVPSYVAFAKFLRDDYVPRGRAEPGMWALPDGIARYNARIKQTTTTDLTADQIHEIGLAEVARIEAEQAVIGKRLGFADFAAFKDHVRHDRKLYARSRADILARYRKYTDQMYTKLPALFGRLPRQRMTIEPVETFREKEASGAQYDQGTQDGSRPGMVRVNTYEPTKRLTIDMESTAYHEGVPGHHMQIAIQQELGELPPFRQQAFYVAFQEGWALYSERLGKEVGFYQDPYNDYGRLQDEMLRAIRLVVDTGLHAKHWTRQQVVQFFHDHSTIDEPSVQSETDRYIAIPGQALGYKIGQLTISRLRDKAQAALGKAFDIRGFHDEVLGAGALPLDILERRIDAWIARQK